MNVVLNLDQWRGFSYLSKAEGVLVSSPAKATLFIRKWKAVAHLQLSLAQGDSPSLSDLDAIRREAESLGHWETVRDCDRHQAILLKDAGKTRGRKVKGLEVGQTLHRLLTALSMDHYHPARLIALHQAIYPDEFFNPM